MAQPPKRITPIRIAPTLVSPPITTQINNVATLPKPNNLFEAMEIMDARNKIREANFDKFEEKWRLKQEAEEAKTKKKTKKMTTATKPKKKKECKKIIHVKAHTRVNKNCKD